MDKNILEFEDYNINIDLNEIENMNEEEVKEALKKVEELKKMVE